MGPVHLSPVTWPQALRQRWAKGPIDRSSDTDSIFRLYRTIQSVDVKFRFLNRPIVLVRFEFRFFNRPILFLGLKFRFLYRPIVSVRFEFRFFNRPILFLGLKFRFLISQPRWKTSLCNPLVCVYAYGQPRYIFEIYGDRVASSVKLLAILKGPSDIVDIVSLHRFKKQSLHR